MPAFGLAAHTVHVAAWTVGTAGALAFLHIAVLRIPALLPPRSLPAPHINGPTSTTPISDRRKLVSVFGVVPMVLLICCSLVNLLRTAFTDGPSPVTVQPVLAMTAFLLHLLGSLS